MFESMRKWILHINQHVIKANIKNNERNPVITVKRGEENTYAHQADILDKDGNVVASIIYRPDNPLSCGARVWMEVYPRTGARVVTHALPPAIPTDAEVAVSENPVCPMSEV